MKQKFSDDKTFWKIMKPFSSDKATPTQKITLIEKEEIITGDDNTQEILNTFFSNIVRDLKIELYSNCDPLANNIRDPVLKCKVKYRNHPSILLLEKSTTKTDDFLFPFQKYKETKSLVTS